MKDPMLLNEFVENCLASTSLKDMEAMMHEVSTLSFPGSDSNSTKSTAEINNDKQQDAIQECSDPEEAMKDAETKTTTPRRRPKRLPEQCHNHILAERQRRQTLSERFIAMSALIPSLQKTDKTSILGAAITHMQQLKERLKILEEANAKKSTEPVVVIKRPKLFLENNESNSSISNDNLSNRFYCDQFLNIEARFSSNNVLIKIQCAMRKGIPLKIMNKLEKLQLFVTSANAIPFHGTLDITITAQMETNFNMTPQDVVQSLRSTFSFEKESSS